MNEAVSTPKSELEHVLIRTAAAARQVTQFDRMGLWLAKVEDRLRALTLDGGQVSERLTSRREFSDKLWPVDAGTMRLPDCEQALDLAFGEDQRVVASGLRSLIVMSLRAEGRTLVAVWFGSSIVDGLSASDADALESLADLLTMAVAYDRRWLFERERRRRQDQLEALLPEIASALDVRSVLPRMSAVIQDVIPHATVALALLTPDGQGVRIHAASNYDVGELPEYRFTTEGETIRSNWRAFIMKNCEVLRDGVMRAQSTDPATGKLIWITLTPGPAYTELLQRFDIHSVLRVPVRVQDQTVGAISFGAGPRFVYDEDDIVLATRIADHVALALAHEQLAEEARRLAQAAERETHLQTRVDTLVQELEERGGHRALGSSSQWKDVLVQATKVANTDTTVLITGESGTGKEVVARYIHRGSRRARAPFVALNCAALPEQLLESELFGYERGAFTGAHVARAGRIEQAAGGVLFLDEVGEMSPPVQAKFLRVLQEREFQRLGGTRTLKADVRVIAATNRDPRVAMERGTLREDLYYRLGVFEIALPPLRHRPDDILVLADAFLVEIGRNVGRPSAGLSDDARTHLMAHAWPGNVRELRNALERAVILCEGGLVTSEHLPGAIARSSKTPAVSPAIAQSVTFPAEGVALAAVERDLLQQALVHAKNNKSQAAKLLGLPRGQFYSLLRRHGLTDARR